MSATFELAGQGPCGWLTDKLGVSWQVIPRVLGEMLNDEDPEKAKRVMNAMLQMSKIEIDGLRRAYEAEEAAGTVASSRR
jgi:predicted 3-demethylubiquinone-9 3-methyltransferase (glyoxalase superfamily)